MAQPTTSTKSASARAKPARPGRASISTQTLAAGRKRIEQIGKGIDALAKIGPEAATAAPALRAALAPGLKAIALIERAQTTGLDMEKASAPVLERLVDEEARRIYEPMHDVSLDSVRKRVMPDVRQRVLGGFAEKVEASLQPEAVKIAGVFVGKLRDADKSIRRMRLRLGRPPVDRLPQGDRPMLASLGDHYRSLFGRRPGDDESATDRLVQYIADCWSLEGDKSVELARIDASCRGWLSDMLRGGGLVPGGGWRPPLSGAPQTRDQIAAKQILEALDTVAARNVAPAVRVAEELYQALVQLFVKLCGLDPSVGGNVSRTEFDVRFSKGSIKRDPLEIAEGWPFRYASGTDALVFTPFQIPQLAPLNGGSR